MLGLLNYEGIFIVYIIGCMVITVMSMIAYNMYVKERKRNIYEKSYFIFKLLLAILTSWLCIIYLNSLK